MGINRSYSSELRVKPSEHMCVRVRACVCVCKTDLFIIKFHVFGFGF